MDQTFFDQAEAEAIVLFLQILWKTQKNKNLQ